MTKETMTVHEALAELKTLDKRIGKKIKDTLFVGYHRITQENVGVTPVKEFEAMNRDQYKSIDDLIKRRNALKRAVVLSNATTKVEVGGTTYTVAEAIDMKNNGMDNYEKLLVEISMQYNPAVSSCRIANEKLVENATHSLQQIQGSGEMKADEASKFIEEFTHTQRLDIVSGINCPEIMAELEEKIATFEAKIDSALSVSNAITTIEFEY